MENFCSRCGHDYRPYPQYQDFVHFIPGTRSPCLPPMQLTKEVEKGLDEIVKSLSDRLCKTLRGLDGQTSPD